MESGGVPSQQSYVYIVWVDNMVELRANVEGRSNGQYRGVPTYVFEIRLGLLSGRLFGVIFEEWRVSICFDLAQSLTGPLWGRSGTAR